LSYTLNDSSSTRLSVTLGNISLSSTDGTATVVKRWTVYPTGRIFGSFQYTAASFNFDAPSVDVNVMGDNSMASTWSNATSATNGRWAASGGNLTAHSLVAGILSIKNATSNYTSAASTVSSTTTELNLVAGSYFKGRMNLLTSRFTSANIPITVNFALDLSTDFTDSATADSLMKDLQTPAVLAAITGTRTTNDALDFNADNFAEGDGAYTYQAASGIAHFKFVNAATSFNPAFRINTWTYGTLPEVIILDNQILTKGYHYNAYLNTATSEVVLQFNKTLAPGTHVFFISHKTGLAVSLRSFEAKGGEGVDTLQWTTESEFENLGYHVWRRVAPAEAQLEGFATDGERVAGAGIANALSAAARTQAAAKAAAKLAQASASEDSTLDTLPSMTLTPDELAALGYVRITAKLIPGAKGGSSASTQNYRFIDRTAAMGVVHEYLLEALDFNGTRAQYGPRTARPTHTLVTELGSNYPNPFNPITTLRFSIKEKIRVSLVIYDGKGRLVRTLVRPQKEMLPGKYRLIWDAKDEGGFEVPTGQYFYRFTAGRYVKTRKMILVK
ncbi:MAG: hypothetical protein M3Y08_03800, partial [Fibrobacterota bacterium]|nr:hypothetical protein [Fibrobacterota bacterium]